MRSKRVSATCKYCKNLFWKEGDNETCSECKLKESLFKEFLEAYLKNVSRILPTSYRALQLNSGGYLAKAVYEFEEKFLWKPFTDALEKVSKKKSEKSNRKCSCGREIKEGTTYYIRIEKGEMPEIICEYCISYN